MKAETYRVNAEFCRQQAALAVRGDDIRAWSRLAESWAVLLRGESRLMASRAKLSRITRYVELA
jgi:hypothetical protein